MSRPLKERGSIGHPTIPSSGSLPRRAPKTEFKLFVKRRNQPLWAKIEPGRLIGFVDGTLRLGFPKGYLFLDFFDEKPQREKLEDMAREFFCQPVSLAVETVDNGPGEANGGSRNGPNQSRANQLRREALNHPLLQKVMDVFEGAEVQEVIVKEK